MSSTLVETAAPGAPAPAPRPAPLASRIVDIFFSPARAFEQLRDGDAPWLGPVVVSAAVFLVLVALRPLFISNHEMARFALDQMQASGRTVPVTADDLAAKMTLQSAIGAVAVVIWCFLRAGVVGLILAGVFGLMMGGRTQPRPYVAVASHAFLVPTAGFALVAALQYATHRLDLALDASLLAPNAAPGSVLSGVLHGITPFGVWLVILLAVGGATVNRRKGWVGAAALLFAVQMALVTAFAFLGHLFVARAAAGR